MLMRKYIGQIIMLLAVVSCATTEESQLAPLKHARLLTMQKHDGWTEAQIRNPWDTTKVMQKLAIIEDSEAKPGVGKDVTVINAPLKHSLVMSSVHCSLIAELNSVDAIAAVCDAEYVKEKSVAVRIKEGKIKDCGNSMTPAVEQIAMVKPDAVLISPYKDNDLTKLNQLGINMVQCADYMEPTPLGRAEWVRLYGMLVGKVAEADSLFSEVEKHYLTLKSDTVSGPKIISDSKYGEVWYVPTGNSTVGQMYADAGGVNPFSDRKENGSVALSPEEVLMKAKDGDVWILKSDGEMTLDQLRQADPINSQFKAFAEGNVWHCNTVETPFYEQTPFHPNLLLEDFVYIFHPEKRAGKTLHYFKKMEH